jgi:very-short-patch-repair endonuclease
MGPQIPQKSNSALLALTQRQHGVVTRSQMLELGFSPWAIKHRIAIGRLHPLLRGVYAVGRPAVTRRGRWMAAVLSCGPDAVLSHESAAALWGIRPEQRSEIDVSVLRAADRRRPGIVVHRRPSLSAGDCARKDAIPVTTPVRTLVDLATCLQRDQLEAAVNEADKRDLTDAEVLRSHLAGLRGGRGVPRLRELLDRRTFTLTDSELERRFLPLTRKVGLPKPQTGRYVNGFRVDFYWPDLGLIVETDGLRYHRTPAQQARDRLRDQAHLAAGLTPLRFTHAQVRFSSGQVLSTLQAVASRLRAHRVQ